MEAAGRAGGKVTWPQVREQVKAGEKVVVAPASREARRRVARLKAGDMAGQARAKEG